MSTQAQQIKAAIWTLYMRTGDAATVKTIALETGRSTSWVRKHVQDAHDNDVDATDVYVERRDKSYGAPLTSQRVDAWIPSRKWLRRELLEARAPLPACSGTYLDARFGPDEHEDIST